MRREGKPCTLGAEVIEVNSLYNYKLYAWQNEAKIINLFRDRIPPLHCYTNAAQCRRTVSASTCARLRRGPFHQLAVHTVDGVISNGETIMQIVPRADELAVEAKVAPFDIDQAVRLQGLARFARAF